MGVAGGSGSGKSYVAKKICEKLGECLIVSMDDYIIPEKVSSSDNWDLPEIWDLKKIKQDIINLHKGIEIKKPIYDFSKHSIKDYEKVFPKGVIIVEGIYSLHKVFEDFLDFRIFVDADEGVRLKRRIKRDFESRGRTEDKVRKKWESTVQPMYLKFVNPQKEVANLILNNENIVN